MSDIHPIFKKVIEPFAPKETNQEMADEELNEIVRAARQAVASGHPTDQERAIAELSGRLQRFQLAHLAARRAP